MNTEKMLEIGNLWEKNGYRRIYFKDIESLIGLNLSFYNTGNISGATLNGEKISNGQARKISNSLPEKFWFDLNKDEFGCKPDSPYFAELVEAVMKIVS